MARLAHRRPAHMLERDIEKYFKGCVTAKGGEIRKVKWVNRPHAPDRVVFLRGVYFVELKRPGEDLRPGQAREHKRMKLGGADVRTISTIAEVDAFISELVGKWQDQG